MSANEIRPEGSNHPCPDCEKDGPGRVPRLDEGEGRPDEVLVRLTQGEAKALHPKYVDVAISTGTLNETFDADLNRAMGKLDSALSARAGSVPVGDVEPSRAALDEWGEDAAAFQKTLEAGHLNRYLTPPATSVGDVARFHPDKVEWPTSPANTLAIPPGWKTSMDAADYLDGFAKPGDDRVLPAAAYRECFEALCRAVGVEEKGEQ